MTETLTNFLQIKIFTEYLTHDRSIFKIRPEKYLNSYSIHKISNSPLNNFLQIKIFIECLSVHRIDQFSLTYYIKILAEKYQPFPNATNSYSTILKISFFHPPQILSRSVPRTNFKLSPSFFFFFFFWKQDA